MSLSFKIQCQKMSHHHRHDDDDDDDDGTLPHTQKDTTF
jgi:hypothetical protein